MADYSEILLIEGLNNGNHSSFRSLYNLYSAQLYNFAYNILKSQSAAEDIVQDTFVKIWDRRTQIRTSGSFKSLLITIALNSIRQSFNELSKENQLKDELLISLTKDSEKYSAEDLYENLLAKLEELIAKMPEKRKLVFTKAKLEGMKAKELSKELGISVKTVEYHVAEAMKFLKAEFKNNGLSESMLLFLIHLAKV